MANNKNHLKIGANFMQCSNFYQKYQQNSKTEQKSVDYCVILVYDISVYEFMQTKDNYM